MNIQNVINNTKVIKTELKNGKFQYRLTSGEQEIVAIKQSKKHFSHLVCAVEVQTNRIMFYSANGRLDLSVKAMSGFQKYESVASGERKLFIVSVTQ